MVCLLFISYNCKHDRNNGESKKLWRKTVNMVKHLERKARERKGCQRKEGMLKKGRDARERKGYQRKKGLLKKERDVREERDARERKGCQRKEGMLEKERVTRERKGY